MGNGLSTLKPYGLPVLVQADGTLKQHDPQTSEFLGIAYSADSVKRLQEKARQRWDRENAARMKELADRKAAAVAEKAEQEKRAQEQRAAKEQAERNAQAIRDKKAATLAAADTLIYGD